MRKLYSLLLCLPLAFLLSCNNQEAVPANENTDSIASQTSEIQPNDKQISYYDNGQAQFMQQYLNGIKHGEYKDWFKNGQLRTMGYYDMGMRNGTWKWYGEKGEIALQVKYDKTVAELY